MAAKHRPTTKAELGYERRVCGECGGNWPCPEEVKARCERLDEEYCYCGWHEDKPHA